MDHAQHALESYATECKFSIVIPTFVYLSNLTEFLVVHSGPFPQKSGPFKSLTPLATGLAEIPEFTL